MFVCDLTNVCPVFSVFLSLSWQLHDTTLSKKEKKQRKSALKKAVRKERKTQSQDSKDSLSMVSDELVI